MKPPIVAKSLLTMWLAVTVLLLFSAPAFASQSDDQFLDMVEKQAFLFFYESADAHNFTVESTAWSAGSTASTGFYLSSIPIAVERGWISHDDGYGRALSCLGSYYDDPADTGDFYVESARGFFPHWFARDTGKWNGVDCYSSIDHAIFLSGALTVGEYFQGTDVETLADKLYKQTDWAWMLDGKDTLSMGWRPDSGFLSQQWTGYNEGMLAVLLALGSPTYPIPERCWDAWARTYTPVTISHGDESYSFVESTSPSLFTYQYPQVWFDLSGKKDPGGVDYFQNSVNASRESQAYSIENPGGHRGYGADVWGLTACECPLHDSSYFAQGPKPDLDDGTVAPTGAGGSILFTPVEAIRALRYMNDTYGDYLWGRYGFRDSFNPDLGWYSPTYISIDQGVILTMAENYRSGLVQSLFMRNDYAIAGLAKAGFTDTSATRTLAEAKNAIAASCLSTGTTGMSGATLQEQLRAEMPADSLPIENFNGGVPVHEVGAWHGGDKPRPIDCVIMLTRSENSDGAGYSLKVRYNVETPGSYNGIFIKPGTLDLRALRDTGSLIFRVKGDATEGYPGDFVVKLEDGTNRIEYRVHGMTDSWQAIAIPLKSFSPQALNWDAVTAITVVFENQKLNVRKGAIFLDDIYFSPTGATPVPAPVITVAPGTSTVPGPTAATPAPGYGLLAALAGLVIALVARVRK